MPRRSRKLRRSDTGSSGTWEVECLKILCPQRESAVSHGCTALSDGQEAFVQQRKEIHCLSPFFLCLFSP